LISDVRPSVFHGMLPLFLFEAASITFLFLLKHHLPQNKSPSHSLSSTADITFLKATRMNEILTTQTITCLQGFILFKAPCT